MGAAESTSFAALPSAVQALGFRGDGQQPRLSDLATLALEKERLSRVEDRLRSLTKPPPASKRQVNIDCFQNPRGDVDLATFTFDLKNERDRLAAAAITRLDPRISKCKPALVPSTMTENTFFKNYFTYVQAIRRWVIAGGDRMPSRASVSDFGATEPTKLEIGLSAFKTDNILLQGCSFPNMESFGLFLSQQPQEAFWAKQSYPSRPPPRDNNESVSRKQALMEMLRCSEPPILSALLEASSLEGRPLDDQFWVHLDENFQRLVHQVESFTSKSVLRGKNRLNNPVLLSAMTQFQFAEVRDKKAVQACWELDYDKALAEAFLQLVPTMISKQIFWGNFLSHVACRAIHQYSKASEE
mmetsp:Transcript_7848/g.14431  ORF Transcript_7848/g.14431 Transcript_7848/m.14431 type:complete len:357 (+) Transcript_7848:367-1437(+)